MEMIIGIERGGISTVDIILDVLRIWDKTFAYFDKEDIRRSAKNYKEWLNSFDSKFQAFREAHDSAPKGHEQFEMLDPVGPNCSLLISLGVGNDEKRICTNSSQLKQQKDCLIVSIGSFNHWAFEEAVFYQTSCHVLTFDCKVNGVVPPRISSRVTFHKICIGEKDQEKGRQIWKTWGTLSEIGHSPPSLLFSIIF